MEAEKPAEALVHEPKPNHAVYPGDYPSNPFKTAATGVKTFWENGKDIVGGIIGLEFLLLIAVWIIAGLTLVTGLVLLLSGASNAQFSNLVTGALPENVVSTSNSLAAVGIGSGIFLFVFLVLLMFTGAFVQALQTAFVGKTIALRQKPTFGDVVKTAWKRMWPLIAQMLLIAAIVFGTFLIIGFVLAALAQEPAALIIVAILLYLVLLVGGVYLMTRIAFAGLDVVVGNLGPWQAIKHSFAITKGHVGEVIGIGAVAFTAATVVGLLINLLQFGVGSTGSAPLMIVAFVVIVALSLVFGFLFMAIITERYAQLTSLTQTKVAHKTEWGSIVGAIALAVFAMMLSGFIQASVFSSGLQTLPQPTTSPTDFLEDQGSPLDDYNPGMTDEEFDEWLKSFDTESPTNSETLLQ